MPTKKADSRKAARSPKSKVKRELLADRKQVLPVKKNLKSGHKKELDRLNLLMSITEDLNHIKDIDAVMDNILYLTRRFTNADAGTIYLREGDVLKFSYFQNDTLAARDVTNNKRIYSIFEVPINDSSISGYVALTGKPLILDDVYRLPDNVPYFFNSYYDELFNYRNQSMMTVPLISTADHVIGVMQIINAKDGRGRIKKFTESDSAYVMYFANNAAVVVERAKMTREIILRMVKMSELRDPKETGNHVNRVAAYTIEIYEKWAKKRGVDEKEIKSRKDVLRISAMLHDVGKVAISDSILKKPARLDMKEFETMKMHTVFGARLFESDQSEWDELSAIISLNHHEKWDGTGYPGHMDCMTCETPLPGPGKKGEDIPIEARIVALADVYDALISRRVYKEAWDENQVLEYIRGESGKHFDPDVVDAFFEIYEVIKAIREKYQEKPEEAV